MANTKSAEKRARKSAVRALRNKMWKSAVRTYARKVRTTAAEGNASAAADVLRQAFSIIDKAAGRGVLHKNAASRKKARLSRRVAAITTTA